MDVNEVLAKLEANRAELDARWAQYERDQEEGATEPLAIPLVGLRKAELTINNGEEDLTFQFKRYHHLGAKEGKWLPPEWYWVDVLYPGERYGSLPVAVVKCIYDPAHPDQLPEFRFVLSTKPNRAADPRVIYAAHLVFLQLSGVNVEKERWTDCLMVEREPTSQYEIQAVAACMQCGRKLRKPASIDLGFGGKCAARLRLQLNYDTKTMSWAKPGGSTDEDSNDGADEQ